MYVHMFILLRKTDGSFVTQKKVTVACCHIFSFICSSGKSKVTPRVLAQIQVSSPPLPRIGALKRFEPSGYVYGVGNLGQFNYFPLGTKFYPQGRSWPLGVKFSNRGEVITRCEDLLFAS
jgi:hypothetical protein